MNYKIKSTKEMYDYLTNNKGFMVSDNQEFNNLYQNVYYICKAHPDKGEQYSRLDRILKREGCRYCVSGKTKQSEDYINNILLSKGLTFIRTEQVGERRFAYYLCEKHADFGIQKVRIDHLDRKLLCKCCVSENNSENYCGENACNWKGGVTSLSKSIRRFECITLWKEEILEKYNYKCALTGMNKNLQVHHLYSFHNILDDSIKELNLDLKENINDYSKEDKINLYNKTKEKHSLDIGVVLTKKYIICFIRYMV